MNLIERLVDLETDDTKEGDVKKGVIEQDIYGVLIEVQTESGPCNPDDLVFKSVKGRKINQNFFERKKTGRCRRVRRTRVS